MLLDDDSRPYHVHQSLSNAVVAKWERGKIQSEILEYYHHLGLALIQSFTALNL